MVDADGNPLTLPTSDGQHIKVVMGIDDDQQSVQRLLADGTLVPIDLIIQDTKSEQAEILTAHPSKGDEKDSVRKLRCSAKCNDLVNKKRLCRPHFKIKIYF